MLEHFSYSSLQTFDKCPAQFKFRYIDFIKKPDEGIEAFMGKRAHESIEYLYKMVMNGTIPLWDEIRKVYVSLWEEKWHDRVAIVYSNNPPRYYFGLGESCLARFYRHYSPFNEPAIATEHEIIFPVGGDSAYKIKSIIDRIDHNQNGDWEIHDYKTGKRSLTQSQADLNNQLAIYNLALLYKADNIQSVTLVWHFLQQGEEIRSKRTKQDLRTLEKKIKDKIDQIRKRIDYGGDFQPKPTQLCNWCYYWEECPAKSGSNPYIMER